ncbi:lytic transglycosylase domain-containing protein [Salmonella enterica]|uniref:Lytic transglycosylase domain-containing protein n=3 Tax=Enterobacteriaceae TaxID=543 RepID=A0A7B0U099_ECOLX|nr:MULTISPECIES: lytic transglycosylase domain-containing protein [Enterobacteriaceae]EAA7507589.1 traL protein [Salmonella enterica]EAR0120072.1 traL protein [Salmonella enterica subsp. enterica serovar Javiana]EAY2652171.1 traL protein [Salmonella enterica subsp. enterica serovar Dublin]EBK1137049.1 traL protein [Salmonella enterica subsp. enterica serovar Uganda]EBO1456200.1 lytic transglycosylase domain-containing protein [Salmonella enterica subsp. enterica serovar Newport]EBP4160252.1 l
MKQVVALFPLLIAGLLDATPANAELSAPVMALAKRCAPEVHPLTIGYLVSHESRNNPYAINVNVPKGTKSPLARQPRSLDEAVKTTKWLTAHGYNFDVGLGQINSANFPKLNVSAADLFNGCKNLEAAQYVLNYCYQLATKEYAPGQSALRHALSCYNTGSLTAGFTNGYVSKVVAQIGQSKPVIPALKADDGSTDVESVDTAIDAVPVDAADGEEQPKDAGMTDAFSGSDKDAFGASDGDAFRQK